MFHTSLPFSFLLDGAMNSSDRLVGSPSREGVEKFLEARLVLVTLRALTSWLNPFGMLGPQVFVNLLL
jgi:hypothetical protein